MQEFHGSASARIGADPHDVFDILTDVDRLPEWNAAIEKVLDCPPALVSGAEWTVQMHPPRVPTWRSISRVEEVDRDRGRFAYETRHADGNPSFVKWAWEVVPTGDGADVSVTWDCYLKTFDRRVFAGPLRRRQLAREVPNSLRALAVTVGATEST